jgi:hypothetical protein
MILIVKEFAGYKDEFFNSDKRYIIKRKNYIIHTWIFRLLAIDIYFL